MKEETRLLNKSGHAAQRKLSGYLRKLGLWSDNGPVKKKDIPKYFAANPILNGSKYSSPYNNINHRLLDILARLGNKKYLPDDPAQISKPSHASDNIVEFKRYKNKIDVTKQEFLESYAWRKLRIQVIEAYGRRCMCCGNTPEHGAIIHVDHIKPRKKYPELALDFDNLQVLCHECNHGKGNWLEKDWRKTLE